VTIGWNRACIWMVACLLLAACVPGAAGTGGAALTPTAGITQAPTATATVQWFPPTGVPTPIPSPVITPTPDPRPGIGAALLSDGFAPGQPWQTGKSAAGTISLSGSELTLAVGTPNGALLSLLARPELGDFYAEVSASPSLCRGADAFGLLLHAAGGSSSYRWTLTCDGQERLERVRNGAFIALQANIPRAGPPTPTRLAVWFSGKEMRFFINDIYQFAASDPTFPTGSLGIFARAAADTPLTVTFSDLSIYTLTPLPTPVPSLTTTP
jgi:hypothetical protein